MKIGLLGALVENFLELDDFPGLLHVALTEAGCDEIPGNLALGVGHFVQRKPLAGTRRVGPVETLLILEAAEPPVTSVFVADGLIDRESRLYSSFPSD